MIKAGRSKASGLKSQELTGGKKGKLREMESGSPHTHLTLDDMVRRAIEMGAEAAKWIHTDSIVVEKWVKWKCIYGCPMYGKDGYHPPETPDIDEVREVIGEYAKAIMLRGRDGTRLTEIACRLEGEAYHSGFYKAFALTALSAGTSTGAAPGGT